MLFSSTRPSPCLPPDSFHDRDLSARFLGKSIGSLQYQARVVDAIKRPTDESTPIPVPDIPEEEEVEEPGHFDDEDVRSDVGDDEQVEDDDDTAQGKS
jgi:hypothetical protein